MMLRIKTLLLAGTTLIVVAALLLIAARTILLDGYVRLEQTDMQHRVGQVLATVSNEINGLNASARDYAGWDDTYLYVKGNNPDYVESNFPDGATLNNLNITAIAILDVSGQFVFGQAVNAATGEAAPLPPALADAVTDPMYLMRDLNSSVSGILITHDGNRMIVAAQPILTSRREGPIEGTLIFFRALTDDLLQQWSASVGLPLVVESYASLNLSADFQTAHNQLTGESPIMTQTLSDDRAAGYGLSLDVLGQPALIFRVDQPRSVYVQGATTINALIAVILAVVVLIGLLVLLLDRQLMIPLLRLSAEVEHISADPTARVTTKGHNEIAALATSINTTLDALAQSQKTVRDNENQLQAVVNNAPVTLWALDRDGLITLLKGKGLETLGLQRRTGDQIDSDVYRDLQPLIESSREALNGRETGTVLHLDAKTFDVRCSPLHDEKGAVIGAIGVATDISALDMTIGKLNNTINELSTTQNKLQQTFNEVIRQNNRLVRVQQISNEAMMKMQTMIMNNADAQNMMETINQIRSELSRLNY